MIHRLLYPATVQGKVLHFALVGYLSISIIGCTAPQPTVKPPTTIARAMETRTFSKDMKTVLKAAINALQDMDYTINVLNSDVGLIAASRTTEQKKSELSHDENEVEGLSEIQKTCLIISGVVIVAIMLGAIFGGDDDDSGKNSNDRSPIRIGGGDGKDDPTGPRIYRYKVTINLNDLDADNTKIRVSASGEIEQDGKILSTGGIHELEFFQQFFANVNKALFLEDQGQ
jgi:hypothetical protein